MDSKEFENNDCYGGGLPDPSSNKKNDLDNPWGEVENFLKEKNVCPFFYYSFADLFYGDEGGVFFGKMNPALSYHCFWREYNRCDNNLYLEEDQVVVGSGKYEKNAYRCKNYMENKCLGDYGQCEILKHTLLGTRGDDFKPVLKLEGINIPFKKSETKEICEIIDSQIGRQYTNWFGKINSIAKSKKPEESWKIFLEALGHYCYRLSEFEDHYCLCDNPKRSDKAGFGDINTDKGEKEKYNKRYCMKQFEKAAIKSMEEQKKKEEKAKKEQEKNKKK